MCTSCAHQLWSESHRLCDSCVTCHCGNCGITVYNCLYVFFQMWWLGWASQEKRSESHWPTKSTMKSLLHTCCWGARMRWVYQLGIFIYFVCLFLSQNEKILHYIHIQDGAVYVIILILFTAVLCRSFSCNHSQNTIELHVLLNIPAWILRLRHEINWTYFWNCTGLTWFWF